MNYVNIRVNILLASTVNALYYRWYCKDRRYEIRLTASDNKKTYSTASSRCGWYNEYDHNPADYECVLTYCDNATEAPNLSHNYAYQWDEKVIPLGKYVEYPCMENMAVENNTANKVDASTSSFVLCGADGYLVYPDPWPQCSETIECELPSSLNIPADIYTTFDEDNVFYKDRVRLVNPDLLRVLFDIKYFQMAMQR